MAQHWLDLARYADTNGITRRRPRNLAVARLGDRRAEPRHARSTGSSTEQLAGDLLPNATPSRRSRPASAQRHVNDEAARRRGVPRRVRGGPRRTRRQVFLGLTVGCARATTTSTTRSRRGLLRCSPSSTATRSRAHTRRASAVFKAARLCRGPTKRRPQRSRLPRPTFARAAPSTTLRGTPRKAARVAKRNGLPAIRRAPQIPCAAR